MIKISKTKNKKFLFFVLFIIDIVLMFIIFCLGIYIYISIQNRINNQPNINYIKSSETNKSTSYLKYFYQPNPDFKMIDNPSWLKQAIKYTINKNGLNERFDYKFEKDLKNFRIITLGDSFTFGQYINTNQNYSEILEDNLNNNLHCREIKHFDVINLGVPGYDLEYEVERFNLKGLNYNPDLVIWLINDWNISIINELMKPINEELLKDSKEKDEIKRFETAWIDSQKKLKKIYGDKFITSYQKYIIHKMNKIYKGNLLIVYFPEKMKTYKDIIGEFVKLDDKYSLHDLDFNYWNSSNYQLPDHHPNEKGHKIIAIDIYLYLLKNYFTECNEIN